MNKQRKCLSPLSRLGASPQGRWRTARWGDGGGTGGRGQGAVAPFFPDSPLSSCPGIIFGFCHLFWNKFPQQCQKLLQWGEFGCAVGPCSLLGKRPQLASSPGPLTEEVSLHHPASRNLQIMPSAIPDPVEDNTMSCWMLMEVKYPNCLHYLWFGVGLVTVALWRGCEPPLSRVATSSSVLVTVNWAQLGFPSLFRKKILIISLSK